MKKLKGFGYEVYSHHTPKKVDWSKVAIIAYMAIITYSIVSILYYSYIIVMTN